MYPAHHRHLDTASSAITRHVAEFHALFLQWLAEPPHQPSTFAKEWVAYLLTEAGLLTPSSSSSSSGAAFTEVQALDMLEQQVQRARIQHGDAVHRGGAIGVSSSNAVALEAREEIAVSQLTSVFLAARAARGYARGGGRGGGAAILASEAPPLLLRQTPSDLHVPGASPSPSVGGGGGEDVELSPSQQQMKAQPSQPSVIDPTTTNYAATRGAWRGGVGAKPPTHPRNGRPQPKTAATSASVPQPPNANVVVVNMDIAKALCYPGAPSAQPRDAPVVTAVQQVLRSHEAAHQQQQQSAAAVAVVGSTSQGERPPLETIFSADKMKEVRQRLLEERRAVCQKHEDLLHSLRSPRELTQHQQQQQRGGSAGSVRSASYRSAASSSSSSSRTLLDRRAVGSISLRSKPPSGTVETSTAAVTTTTTAAPSAAGSLLPTQWAARVVGSPSCRSGGGGIVTLQTTTY